MQKYKPNFRFIDVTNIRPFRFQYRCFVTQQFPDVFRYMRTNGRQYQRLPANIFENQVHMHATNATQFTIFVSRQLQFEETEPVENAANRFTSSLQHQQQTHKPQRFLEQQFGVVLVRLPRFQIHFADEDFVVERVGWTGTEQQFRFDHFFDPFDERVQPQYASVGCRLDEIGIFDTVTSIG